MGEVSYMAKKEKEKKPKEIIFSEETDSTINGYAIGLSFTGIGVFLLLKPDYFAIPIISYIVGAVIGVIGVLGTGVELSKHSKVRGLDNLVLGMLFLGGWLLGYTMVHSIWLNILIFVLLVLGCYAVCRGLIQGVVSIARNIRDNQKEKNESKGKVIGSALTQTVLFLTQLCGLLLAIINVLKAIPQTR